MRQKLLAAVAGGEAPDIARMDIVRVPEFAELGGLATVDELIPDFATYAEQFYPGRLPQMVSRVTTTGCRSTPTPGFSSTALPLRRGGCHRPTGDV